jgi:hypothetical protein
VSRFLDTAESFHVTISSAMLSFTSKRIYTLARVQVSIDFDCELTSLSRSLAEVRGAEHSMLCFTHKSLRNCREESDWSSLAGGNLTPNSSSRVGIIGILLVRENS